MANTNTMAVTAADNDLIIIAYQATGAYELCSIQSGNSNTVTVNITITAGPFLGTTFLNGVNNNLNQPLSLTIPSGTYNIQLLGIDWGTKGYFSVTVVANGVSTPYTYGPTPTPGNGGLVFSPASFQITV
jgi:hypothetical protein